MGRRELAMRIARCTQLAGSTQQWRPVGEFTPVYDSFLARELVQAMLSP